MLTVDTEMHIVLPGCSTKRKALGELRKDQGHRIRLKECSWKEWKKEEGASKQAKMQAQGVMTKNHSIQCFIDYVFSCNSGHA